MSLRRFLNVVENRRGCVYALRRINLARQDLFYPTPPPPPPNGNNRSRSAASHANLAMMESIRLPAPSIEFQPTPPLENTPFGGKLDCFALSESKIICTDQSARAFLYDADLRRFQTMPSLHALKDRPISFSIPGADEQDVARLYVMEAVPKPEKTPDICQFEAFVYCIPERSYEPIWHCLSLPLPPFVHESSHHPPEINSYAVLGGGSHLCISVEGMGTFCFDTASSTWREAGDWELPFFGKAEYIPELNIWFGQSAVGDNLCVSDLSSVLKDRKPRSCNVSRIRDPPEWELFKPTELISLGSGRFCIAKFFNDMRDSKDFYDKVIDQSYVVFTGVEVVPSGDQDKPSGNGNGGGNGNNSGSGSGNADSNGSVSDSNGSGNGSGSDSNGSGCGNGNGNGKGKGRFRMIEHKSKRWVVGTKIIESVF